MWTVAHFLFGGESAENPLRRMRSEPTGAAGRENGTQLACYSAFFLGRPGSRRVDSSQIQDRLFLPVLVAEGRSPIHGLPHRLFLRLRLRFIHICYPITRQQHGPGAQAILRRSCGGVRRRQETRAERVAGRSLASRAGHGERSLTKVRGIVQCYRPKSCVPVVTGGIASLNHRLIASIPPGC